MKANLEQTVQYLTEAVTSGIVISEAFSIARLPDYITKSNVGRYYLVDDNGVKHLYVITNDFYGHPQAYDLGEWPARGPQGVPGIQGPTPSITISDHDTWVINGIDTEQPTRGEQGEDGAPGIMGRPGVSPATITQLSAASYTPTIEDDPTYATYNTQAKLTYWVNDNTQQDVIIGLHYKVKRNIVAEQLAGIATINALGDIVFAHNLTANDVSARDLKASRFVVVEDFSRYQDVDGNDFPSWVLAEIDDARITEYVKKAEVDDNVLKLTDSAGNVIEFEGGGGGGDIEALQEQVDEIESLIPDAASTSNQLADKAFVNDSINEVAARYVTASATGQSFATVEWLNEGPYFYNGQSYTPTTNDYAIVSNEYEQYANPARYLYTGSQWAFQYSYSNIQLSDTQMAALDSGINSSRLGGIEADLLRLSEEPKFTSATVSGSKLTMKYYPGGGQPQATVEYQSIAAPDTTQIPDGVTKIITINKNNQVGLMGYSSIGLGNHLAQYQSSGRLTVTAPSANTDAATKGYVDDKLLVIAATVATKDQALYPDLNATQISQIYTAFTQGKQVRISTYSDQTYYFDVVAAIALPGCTIVSPFGFVIDYLTFAGGTVYVDVHEIGAGGGGGGSSLYKHDLYFQIKSTYTGNDKDLHIYVITKDNTKYTTYAPGTLVTLLSNAISANATMSTALGDQFPFLYYKAGASILFGTSTLSGSGASVRRQINLDSNYTFISDTVSTY